jgi:hypothetical protein
MIDPVVRRQLATAERGIATAIAALEGIDPLTREDPTLLGHAAFLATLLRQEQWLLRRHLSRSEAEQPPAAVRRAA